MARKTTNSFNKDGRGRARSATTGHQTKGHGKGSPSTTARGSRKGATGDAGEFADRFMERYPGTFRELSER